MKIEKDLDIFRQINEMNCMFASSWHLAPSLKSQFQYVAVFPYWDNDCPFGL